VDLTPDNEDQRRDESAAKARHDPSTNCYCGGPEEIYPHRCGTGRYCKGHGETETAEKE
jgi:hypothetical protein